MKEVLALIEKRKQEFAQLPLFKYMQDKSIHPLQRLSWTPCAAPLIMGFGDLNKYVFRRQIDDEIQNLVNQHTYEDEYHWQWFLQDLETLGFNHTDKFSESLRFMWSEETQKTRQICQIIAMNVYNCEPIIMIVAVKALEGTFHVTLPLACSITKEIQKHTNDKCYFFGEPHFEIENSHSLEENNSKRIVENFKLSKYQKGLAFEIVNIIFDICQESANEMMAYALNNPITSKSKNILAGKVFAV
jgi:hypothetical protein